MGWRFINQKLAEQYGVESMPETAENVAEQFSIGREDQDKYARASQGRAAAAQASGFFADEILPVTIIQRKKPPRVFDNDEHLRADTTLEGLAKLRSPFRPGGSVTAGNASGINDGSCALLLASESAIEAHNLTARARIVATAVVGLEPRIMGCGPAMAVPKVLSLARLSLAEMDVIELNEAFAAQVLAVTRALDLDDLDPRINPNGGAIALGHPLGMSGARLVTTAINQLHKTGGKYAICSMCIGVGQGIAMIIERV
jgi:acetyl-CoA acetyltransferase family protein